MQASSESSQTSALSRQLTSYWYNQHPAIFLMHLKDFSLKIDPKHAQLKSYINTYIQQAEELQKSLADAQVSKKPEINKEQLSELQKKLEDVNLQVDNLTAKLFSQKLANISKSQERVQLEQLLRKFIQGIYNPLVFDFNKILQERGGSQKVGISDLPIYDQQEDNIKKYYTFIVNSQNRNQNNIKNLREKLARLNNAKAILLKEITGFLDSGLFLTTNKLYDASKSLAKINEGERKTEELSAQIKELQEVQNRKLANISLYKQGIAMKTMASGVHSFSTEGSSSDLEAEETESPNQVTTRTQIVFYQEKPKPIYRILLGVWLAILIVSSIIVILT